MSLTRWLSIAVICGLVVVLGCTGDQIAPLPAERVKSALPYNKIGLGGDDPGENGPDDSTELEAIEGVMGKVRFPHFTHSSNGKKARRIPCRKCHHETPAGEDPEEGCVECHELPLKDGDPANGGAEDNMTLANGPNVELVPFNHFTHASSSGYKVACDRCHHTGEISSCSNCHKKMAVLSESGESTPKSKRAFHLLCKGCHQAIEMNQPDTIAPTVCKECHQRRNLLKVPEDLPLNRALHIQCIGCHEQMNSADLSAKAPTWKCTGCHEAKQLVREEEVELAEVEEEKPEEFERDPELEKKVGPEEMVIEHARKAKSGVPFSHKQHQELGEECYACHHKGLKDPTCRTCHKEVKDAKKIYHKNCVTCHRENDVPAKCNNCHPK